MLFDPDHHFQAYEEFDWKRPLLPILAGIRIYQFFKIFETENFKGVPLQGRPASLPPVQATTFHIFQHS